MNQYFRIYASLLSGFLTLLIGTAEYCNGQSKQNRFEQFDVVLPRNRQQMDLILLAESKFATARFDEAKRILQSIESSEPIASEILLNALISFAEGKYSQCVDHCDHFDSHFLIKCKIADLACMASGFQPKISVRHRAMRLSIKSYAPKSNQLVEPLFKSPSPSQIDDVRQLF